MLTAIQIFVYQAQPFKTLAFLIDRVVNIHFYTQLVNQCLKTGLLSTYACLESITKKSSEETKTTGQWRRATASLMHILVT